MDKLGKTTDIVKLTREVIRIQGMLGRALADMALFNNNPDQPNAADILGTAMVNAGAAKLAIEKMRNKLMGEKQ